MNSRRWLSGVLAALCLLASFAYATRELEGAPPAGVHAGHAAATERISSGHLEAMTPDCPMGRPSGDAGGGGEHAHASGHCPFCFTYAFALEASAFVLSPVPEARPAHPDAQHVHTPRSSSAAFDARAPPRSLT